MTYGQSLACLNPCDPQFMSQLLEPRIGRDARVVDVGCGRGATLAWLSAHTGYFLAGVEPDSVLYQEARANCPAAELSPAGAEALPFADRSFHAALMECVFSLLEEPARAAGELKRILMPQGIVLLSDVYTRLSEGIYFGQNAIFRNIYAKQTLESFFIHCGFSLDGFFDRTADMGSMIAQMLMDATARDCLDGETIRRLRQAKTAYGIWLWRKQCPRIR